MNARPTGLPIRVSFEFFPPADVAMETILWNSIERLAPLAPRFVSVTYGADGSTRERTHNVVTRIQRDTALTGAPHLTCIGAARSEILALARGYWDQGIRHLVALRGDLPQGQSSHRPHAAGFRYAAELVAGLAAVAPFDISVAAYPEVHPEARSAAADLDNLKRKIDAGATRAITQFCYDTDVFLRFRDRCAAAGVHAPLVPGILPITRFPQVLRFAERCGASIPRWLHERFGGLDEDREILARLLLADEFRKPLGTQGRFQLVLLAALGRDKAVRIGFGLGYGHGSTQGSPALCFTLPMD